MRISEITSTDLFGGTVRRPLQLIRVTLAGGGGGDRPGTAARPATAVGWSPSVSTVPRSAPRGR